MKYKLMLSTLLVLFLAIVPNALASSSWYVDGVHGNDSNDCRSIQHACKTIGHAVTLASSGDSILVASATYTENLTITFSLNVIGYGSNGTPTSIVVDGGGVNTVFTISNPGTQVTLSNLVIQHGQTSGNGGGINNASTLTISNSYIFSSGATNKGAGIYNTGTLTINHGYIAGNGPSNDGGGINNAGTLTISNSLIYGNSASNSGGIGGNGTLTISNSTIGGNSANNGGGMGDSGLGGTATIVNSTFWQNSAGNGGGIYNTSRMLTISNSTFGSSTATNGAAIYNAGPAATIQNSIVAYPVVGPNCFGPVTSNGYNLSSDGSCNFHSTGDLINTDPTLGPLLQNGGWPFTLTAAELPGSPAINAGNPGGCTNGSGQPLTTDERGYPRPGRGKTRCDMGAYEFQNN